MYIHQAHFFKRIVSADNGQELKGLFEALILVSVSQPKSEEKTYVWVLTKSPAIDAIKPCIKVVIIRTNFLSSIFLFGFVQCLLEARVDFLKRKMVMGMYLNITSQQKMSNLVLLKH